MKTEKPVKDGKKTASKKNKTSFSSEYQPGKRRKRSKDITTYIDEQTKGEGRDMLVKMGLDILQNPETSNTDKIKLLQMFYKYLFVETTHNINENKELVIKVKDNNDKEVVDEI